MNMDYNEIKKIIKESIYETVKVIVEDKIRKLSFNYCVEGVVKQVNANNTYDVLINGNEKTQTVYSMNNTVYTRGDLVYILVINNKYQNKYILTKKPLEII